MAINYDHAKYGVKTRTWFGLMKRFGGENPNSTGGFAMSSGVDVACVEGWYPPGPIEIKKVGIFVQNTLGGASRVRLRVQFHTNDGNDLIATVEPTTTTVTSKTFASAVSLTTDYCTTGSYITITGATTSKGGQSTLSYNTVSGTFAAFIDWVPKFDAGKWND